MRPLFLCAEKHMPSLFYKAAFERRFPLSFLFFEDISIAVTALGEAPTEEEVAGTIVNGLRRCFPNRTLQDEDTEYAASRIEELVKESAKDEPVKEEKEKGANFATSFSKWVSELSPHDVCLVISGFD